MLIDLLILIVVAVVAYWLVTKFFPQPAQMIALLVAGVVLLIWLLQIAGVALPSKLL